MLVAVAAWGAALLLLLGRPRRARIRDRRGRRRGPTAQAVAPVRLARPAGLVAGLAVALTLHPAVGLAGGLLLWWLLPPVIARLDSGATVRSRAALERQLPLAAGLLAACLSSGATLQRSLAIVGAAVQQPARPILQAAAASAALGGSPADIAAVLAAAGSPGWQSLGHAVVRSAATGAPLAELLHAQADQALHTWFAAASARARAVAVRSVLPLALCFLPAFLLLGVAPVVAGLLGGVALP